MKASTVGSEIRLSTSCSSRYPSIRVLYIPGGAQISSNNSTWRIIPGLVSG